MRKPMERVSVKAFFGSEEERSMKIQYLGEKTTYDFDMKTFGHATMLFGPFKDEFDPALIELIKARNRLAVELRKRKDGKPYDERFVYGGTLTDTARK